MTGHRERKIVDKLKKRLEWLKAQKTLADRAGVWIHDVVFEPLTSAQKKNHGLLGQIVTTRFGEVGEVR